MTKLPDSTSRHGILEPSWNPSGRIGYICGAREFPHDVGCDDNPGGIQKARGFEFRRARAVHGTSVDEGKLEMPRNSHPPTLGRSVNLPRRWYEMARSLVVGNGNDSFDTLTAQRMQNQRLPRHVVRSTRFLGEAPQRGDLAGNGLQCQSGKE